MCNLRLLIIDVVHILPSGLHVPDDSRFLEFCHNVVSNDDHVSNDFLEFCLDCVSSDLRFLEFGLDHVSNDLRFLEWKWYSLKCLPSGFQPKELVELNLQDSQIEYLWEGVKVILFF